MEPYKDSRTHNSLSVVLDILGIDYKHDTQRQHVSCPLHDDATPSCHVDLLAGWWRCYQCGASGTPLQLLCITRGVSMREAFDMYSSALKTYVPHAPVTPSAERPIPPLVPIGTTPVAVYLELRGVLRCAVASGVMACNAFEQYGWAACIPIRTEDAAIAGWQTRRLNASAPRKVDTYGKIGGAMFVSYRADTTDYVAITEGPFDAMTLWEHRFPSIAVMGTALTRKRAQWIATRYQTVFVSPDNDGPGIAARDKWLSSLRVINPDIRLIEMVPPCGTDWNESWKINREITRETIAFYKTMV